MHPWDHAQSSARLYGGEASLYYPFHAWLDATKALRAHFTHRALRHHREGIAVAASRSGEMVTTDGSPAVDLIDIGVQHLAEDFNCLPYAADWLRCAAPKQLPSSIPAAEELAARSAGRFGGNPNTWLPLHRWFLEPQGWFTDERHLLMRHHSWGIFEAEEHFGSAIWFGTAQCLPVRIVAEQHVRWVMGRIPDGAELPHCIHPQRWMATASPPQRG